MKNKFLYILILGAVIFQVACKKNDGSSGQPIITNIRTVDTTLRDSSFSSAVPGTLIVIQGSNLGGLQAVFFNDTSAYFNPAYATSTNIIVTIPATAQTSATNPDVPNVIRLVTDHGEVTYSFSLYLPPPYITSISFDNTGSIVFINGGNFQGIKKITFPISGSADTALSYEVNKTFTQITAEIPHATAFTDSLRVYCLYGTAAYSYPPPMTITSVSNENGVGGTDITITGTNFVGIDKVVFPGGLQGSNIVIKDVNTLSVTVPQGITSTDSLHIQGALGTAAAPQLFDSYITHPSPGYLCNFAAQYSSDNTGFVGWTGGYAAPETASTTYPGASNGVGVLQQQVAMPANCDATSQQNFGTLQLSPEPWVANTSESITNYALKFEVYVVTPWSKGQLWISVGDWYGWSTYTAKYAPYETAAGNIFQPSGWVTATIPLTDFITGNEFYKTSWDPSGSPATKFTDYSTTGLAFLIANGSGAAVPVNSVNLAIDNVRIVKVK